MLWVRPKKRQKKKKKRSSVVMSWGVGYRCGSDPVLLWLWHRPAATAPIRLLAWEPPYATGVAPEKAKRPKKKKKISLVFRPHLLSLIKSYGSYS